MFAWWKIFADKPLTRITFDGAPTFIHRHAFHLGTEEMERVTVKGAQAKNLRALLDHHAKHIDEFRSLSSRL
ncbi:hypothetical protein [Halalkalibacter sp. APA_J-10(15)]|uniref:hypothetical protein n=1 Tax=Halalkalibacter sp. APA_J-10(15) TaxID=2933805 RepID=UPI001FF4CF7D|nr:hypothetical protein [Halalkalibacter sp. APA_J-10(15)]MCK0473364.1 hypothetical protein [Halalkalibacter sp. APA_J-10(15)]